MDVLSQMGVQRWKLRDRSLNIVEAVACVDMTCDAIQLSKQLSDVTDAKSLIATPTITTPSTTTNVQPALEQRQDLSACDWSDLAALISAPELCASCHASQSILGDGDLGAKWMFVIDSPSTRDIQAQQLLTGRAGQLFDAILLALGKTRQGIYLTSVFKCPPAEDISGVPAQCDAIVHRQIALVKPNVVVTFGEFASQAVIKANDDLQTLRTNEQRCFSENVAIVATHGLSKMLENPALKAEVWIDLKRALSLVIH